jgi:hypothetical protein
LLASPASSQLLATRPQSSPTGGPRSSVMTLIGWSWIRRDGSSIAGKALPPKPVKLDDRERQAYLSRSSTGGRTAVWPDALPVFQRNWPILSGPDGEVVIRRTRDADHPNLRYDVVSRRGQLLTTITMPANAAIVGFGKATVYVATTDPSTGLQKLTRHPWPL